MAFLRPVFPSHLLGFCRQSTFPRILPTSSSSTIVHQFHQPAPFRLSFQTHFCSSRSKLSTIPLGSQPSPDPPSSSPPPPPPPKHEDDHHHTTRDYLGPDGCRRVDLYTSDYFHWGEELHEFEKPDVFLVDGQKMIRGTDTVPMEISQCISQANIPIYPRTKMFSWVNYDYIMKAEFLFFWIPTFIIFSMAVPCFTLLYMMDEAVFTTMTIKVIGRQWYWVYEVESPPSEDD
eukprot:GHVS01066197.1.p2 GENE.GHVS01066197.1~~GHVS01066197.1.p2  ORF type:complete len:232 (-),score=46.14 GHVS01066197.1:179-874(-)